MHVTLIFDVFSPSGYSCHGRALAKSLHAFLGNNLSLIHRRHDKTEAVFEDSEREFFNNLVANSQRLRKKEDVRIYLETPEFYQPMEGTYNIGFTMWETTRIPDTDLNGMQVNNWVSQMNRMDEIWTASASAGKAFVDSGVTKPVFVVPGPVDTTLFYPRKKEYRITGVVVDDSGNEIKIDDRKTSFACVAQWTPRKNIEDFLVAGLSYLHKDRAVLVLKTYGKAVGQPEDIQGCIKRVKAIKEQINNPDAPRVALITENLSDDQMAEFYSSVNFIVNTSRGEGLCLPLLQGMACGAIPISSTFSAPGEYVTEDVGYPIGFSLEPAVHVSGHPWYRYSQEWGKINTGELGRCMRMLCERELPVLHSRLAANREAGRVAIVTKFSFDAISLLLSKRLSEVVNG